MANQNNPRPTGDDEENDTNEVNHRAPGLGGKRDYERDDEFARMLNDLGNFEDDELGDDLDDDLTTTIWTTIWTMIWMGTKTETATTKPISPIWPSTSRATTTAS